MQKIALLLGVLLVLAGCGSSKFETYDGPEVTRIILFKEERRMHLMHGNTALKSYDVDLGFAPLGHKEQEGDGRTPEGAYVIDRRNPNSQFHLSLGISYPNADDRAYAAERGFSPGGDIFIHGRPKKFSKLPQDWTQGCIAVTNREMQKIYAMVKNGTPIWIYE
ncbi:L,D-transpeptidase family protein [Cognatishimia activa]|uniref:L,D-transpeptidase catalytic domain n=1 Tax=Cognatishimia activa TaxID=1715691 RepID=A0A0P1ILV8_9RHOB|nr:L,D-transpeptidase family protein [Cognatishimia activa]CUI42599.1 L,D-transpeptidase catalytic domain [Cognatishimia activa]CUK24605.1 L,D-transpeptidase catalytic domain [Cognatishimia activa]